MKKSKKNYVYVVLEYDVFGELTSIAVFSNKAIADKYQTKMCFANSCSTYLVYRVVVL